MSLLKLKIVALIDRHQRVTAVADALRMKQPTISFHMKSMEKEWGVKLFEAQAGRIRLTEAGRTLLPYARRIGELYAEAEAAIGEMRESGKSLLRIGCTDCAMAALGRTDWLKAVESATGARIAVARADEESLYRLLEADRLELAICGRPFDRPDRLRSVELLSSPLRLVVPDEPSFLAADPDRWTLIEHAERSVEELADAWKPGFRRPPGTKATLDSVDLILQAVRAGHGAAALPACVLPANAKRAPSAEPPGRPPLWTLHASWNADVRYARPMEAISASLRLALAEAAMADS
ncbi:LysR family transcriptional regulator [Paenibacillaceae bacterium WGS1546]|uniref:LysR family transcriptional regulator n=1 Tax=Cohnella sp. WGS1546 TaxID=3366810 RepID=UPI00372D4665